MDAGRSNESPITIPIYQNPEHVSGLMQQAVRQPLMVDESRENQGERQLTTETGTDTDRGLKLGVALPFGPEVSADLSRSKADNEIAVQISSGKSVQNFQYSQAYYLHRVRELLRASNQLKPVRTVTEAQSLRSGDFVEFQASFRANEVNTLLEILTPDLVGTIAEYAVKRAAINRFNTADFTKLEILRAESKARAEDTATFWREITRAVRADFRSDSTREFYGAIGDGDDEVTAVTICDESHFVVEDKDRILDGLFTVLGKVIAPAEKDVPILERNKLLNRFKPDAIDALLEKYEDTITNNSPTLGSGAPTVDELVDLHLDSRLYGYSFRVIPIAIYA